MADKNDIEIAPNLADSLFTLPGTRASLVARGHRDVSTLIAKKVSPVFLARVRATGMCGLIDKSGAYVVEPKYHWLNEFHEGRAAFLDSEIFGVSYETLLKNRGKNWNGWLFTVRLPGRSIDIPHPGSWGFLDVSGKPIAKERFEFVGDFSEGLACVRRKGKWGFIARDGTVAIEPQFEGARNFQGGLSIVMSEGKCGIADRAGDFAVKPLYYFLREFSEGLACAASTPGKFGYIDKTGSFAIEPRFVRAGDFRSGIAPVEDLNGYRGYINRSGRLIYKMKKQSEYRPHPCRPVDGVAFVVADRKVYVYSCGHKGQTCIGNCADLPCSCDKFHRICTECSLCTHQFCDAQYAVFLDLNGRSILESDNHLLDPVDQFSEGLGMVRLTIPGKTENSFTLLYGFVDASGQMKIRPQFLEAFSFHSGRALVKDRHAGWVLIDTAGEVVSRVDLGTEDPSPWHYGLDSIDSQGPFDLSDRQRPLRFVEGRARIRVDGKIGFIGTDGRILVKPQFRAAADFANGLARVETEEDYEDGVERIGYIDESGKLAIPCQFPRAADFQRVEG